MITEAELKTLSAFFPEGSERTTKEIEKRSGYSHERAYTTLNNLVKKGILSKRKVGNVLLYSVKSFDEKVFLAYAYHTVKRREDFSTKYPIAIKALEKFLNKTRPEIAILFGSYSKGEAKQNSDVDVMCVNGASDTSQVALSLKHEFNLKISPVKIERNDFKNIIKENPELWGEILKYGIVLWGIEVFYRSVFRGDYGNNNQPVQTKRLAD